MKIPHVIDYYWGDDDSIVKMPTKLCIIEKVGEKDKFNRTKLTIRLIHHFGYKVWLGRKRTIHAVVYEKLGKENGPINIIDFKNQYIVPRDINCKDSAKITLYPKSIYHIKEKELLKEVVLLDNKPLVMDYELESYASFTDEGRGVKGSFYTKSENNEVMVF